MVTVSMPRLPEKPPQRNDYHVLVINLPWNQERNPLTDRLIALPLNQWADSQSAKLFLWVNNDLDRSSNRPIIPLSFELLQYWGFTYYTMITWNKETQVHAEGPYRNTTEHILFAYRGKTGFTRESMGKMKTCFTAPPEPEGGKPDRFYENLRTWFQGPRLEIFPERERTGFDHWPRRSQNKEKADLTSM